MNLGLWSDKSVLPRLSEAFIELGTYMEGPIIKYFLRNTKERVFWFDSKFPMLPRLFIRVISIL